MSSSQFDGETIITERLVLRPLQASDSDAIFALRSDPRVLYWTTPDNRAKSDEWLHARLESKKTIIHTASIRATSDEQEQIIGATGAGSVPGIGYTFLPSAWGKGYATEALNAWIQMYWKRFPDGHPLVDEEEKQYLKAVTGPGGEASRGVLRKCGFTWYADKELSEEEKGPEEKGTKVVLSEFRLQKPQHL